MANIATTEVYVPKITPKMILGMPVEQFSYIMLGIGAAAPAIFIITVVIAMQCYKQRQKKKLMRLQLRYQMAQNSMENGHMYRDQRRWTKDDVVLENPILVSRKDIASTSNTAQSIGGSVVIMNGSIRNNPLPDFNPQQSESSPNVFFTDVSVPIFQLNGKPIRLNDAMEVCSIRSNSSSTRSNFELAPSSSTMHKWGFSPQETLLGFRPYEDVGEAVTKTNPMLDELEGCDRQKMFFDQTVVLGNSESSNASNSPVSDKPNEIKTTAIVIENPHFSKTNDEKIASTDSDSAQHKSESDTKEALPDSSVSPVIHSSSPRYTKYSEKQPSSSNKTRLKKKSHSPPLTDSNTSPQRNSSPKIQTSVSDLKNSDKGKNDDVRSSDENENEHDKTRRKSWLFNSYVNKAYDPGPVESESDEILKNASEPIVS